MNDILSEDTKAILLLCCPLVPKSPVRPLSLTEYNKLAEELYKRGLRPATVLEEQNLDALAMAAQIKDGLRLKELLDRRGKLGFFIEEWQQAGIFVVSRADDSYPKRLKQHLAKQRPPLLFGVGKLSILQKGGLGIVGSRNIDQNAELFTQKVAEECAKNDLPVISGGASGVDSIAMLSSLTQGGSAVGFLADSLYKKSLSAKFREHIASGRLVLLSPYHPKVGFSVGAAMGRNKLIYAQANQTLVVSSDFQKGGTWAGATEELKRAKHRPVLVRAEEKAPMGNHELIKLGGIPFSSISEQKNLATTEAISKPSTVVQDSLLAI